MSAHPQISKEEAEEIVKYVLSVSTNRRKFSSTGGKLLLSQHAGNGEEGRISCPLPTQIKAGP
jgi:cytochrome c